MIGFAVLAGTMVGGGLLWLLRPLWAPMRAPGIGPTLANVAVLRAQLDELQAERAAGALSADHHDADRAELLRRALAVAPPAPPGSGVQPRTDLQTLPDPAPGARRTALALLVAIPCTAALLYAQLGAPAAIGAPPPQTGRAAIEQRVAHLAARLQDAPDDVRGWRELAGAYAELQRFPEAARAHARLVALEPDNPDALVDHAEALSAAQGGSTMGAPITQVRKALQLAPANRRALAMAANDAFERKDVPVAIGYWQRLRAVVPADSPVAQAIDSHLADARAGVGLGTGASAVPVPATATTATAMPGR
jgi:cytochrome c-type biogenesis protein CcmH